MFDLSDYPRDARAWFHEGPTQWPSAVAAAINGGLRDEDDLADLVFFMHHGERMSGETGRALASGEPQFAALVDEWNGFRTMVGPLVQGAVPTEGPTSPPSGGTPRDVVDRTGEHVLRKGFASPARRPEQIRGIVLHQTGIAMPRDPARWDHVAAHAGVTSDGRVVHINALRSYVMHANLANAFSVGVEIHGLLPGLADDWRTMPAASEEKHPDLSYRQRRKINFDQRTEVTPAIARASREALAFLVEEALALGCPLTYLWAHRQFDRSRSADPGEELWKEVALWAVDELGLELDPHFTLGSGRAVPREWGVPASAFDYRNREVGTATPRRATMRRIRGVNSEGQVAELTVPT